MAVCRRDAAAATLNLAQAWLRATSWLANVGCPHLLEKEYVVFSRECVPRLHLNDYVIPPRISPDVRRWRTRGHSGGIQTCFRRDTSCIGEHSAAFIPLRGTCRTPEILGSGRSV